MNDKVKLLFEELTFNSEYTLLEEGKDDTELQDLASRKGLQLPSKDLAIFKCKYAMVDQENKNHCTLPRKEVKKALKTLAGKAIDKDHLRAVTVGHWLDAQLDDNDIIAYGAFWKSNFPEDYEDTKNRMSKKNLFVSFEAWGERKFTSGKSYDLTNIEFAGGALLYDTKPAFPNAAVLEFSNRTLEFAHIIEEEVEVEEARIDITKNYIRIRIKEPKEFVQDSFKTIILSKKDNIKAIIGKLTSDPNGSTHIQAVLFSKDSWDKEKAKKWVKENKNLGQIEESNYEMEEAKLSFNWDNETIARLLYETECPTCKMKGWNDVLSIDFENSKVRSKCPGCSGINEYDLTPNATVIKKGKKPEPMKSNEEIDKNKIKQEGGSNIVDELIKKFNKASIEELSTFMDETLVSLSAKDVEIASLKAEKEVSIKNLADSKLETENAKLELEKVKADFTVAQTELANIEKAKKDAIILARKEDLGPEYLANLTDEDLLNDLKFENAKLKKQLKMVKPEPVKAGLEAGAATGNVVDPAYMKQKSIHEKAFQEKK
jgi:phage FluMu protein Com